MTPGRQPRAPELWGGLECTIARVENSYRNQLCETGHDERPEDLDDVAKLGIRTLRYPVLWEAISPDDPERADFRWHDQRLARLRELGIEPIIGLLHHGSGPSYTNLLDPAFPVFFARHAARVAERYPYLNYFTPVNEPLTTARFSALYGVWYPHKKDMRSFARAFINECLATVMGMRAIRSVIPHAKLVQTEDVGKAFSSDLLQYQADFENERRWLTFDILFGRVRPGHPCYRLFLDNGIGEDELHELADGPCPPDIIGINHYLTSERFLEHREDHWPPGHPAGGNGRHRYVDLEAARVHLPEGTLGPGARLTEVWRRYQTPIAITEVHHGCSRDEQLRWLSEIWRTALRLREEKIDIKAVTIWSMFGAVDWNSLLQSRASHYEPGPFDVRTGKPRPTALATAAKALTTQGDFDHPVLDTPGWWHRQDRFYKSLGTTADHMGETRKILVVAREGAARLAMEHVLRHRGLAFESICCTDERILDPVSMQQIFEECRAWAIINLPTLQDRFATAALDAAAASCKLPLVRFEDGAWSNLRSGNGQTSNDRLPQHFWQSGVFSPAGSTLVIRSSHPFSAWDRENLLFEVLENVRRGKRVRLCPNTRATATYLPDVFHAGLDLLIDGVDGLCCLENRSDLSWLDFGHWLTERAGFDTDLIAPKETRNVTSPASSPGAHRLMPSLVDAAGRYLHALRQNDCAAAAAAFT